MKRQIEAPLDRIRRRGLLFNVMSLLWVFPSVGAIWIIVAGFSSSSDLRGTGNGIEAITFDQWIAFAVVLAHGVFAGLGFHYRQLERQQQSGVTRSATTR